MAFDNDPNHISKSWLWKHCVQWRSSKFCYSKREARECPGKTPRNCPSLHENTSMRKRSRYEKPPEVNIFSGCTPCHTQISVVSCCKNVHCRRQQK